MSSYNGSTFSKFTDKDGLASNGVQSIYSDNKGQVCFGTWHGLSIFSDHKITNDEDKEPWTKGN